MKALILGAMLLAGLSVACSSDSGGGDSSSSGATGGTGDNGPTTGGSGSTTDGTSDAGSTTSGTGGDGSSTDTASSATGGAGGDSATTSGGGTSSSTTSAHDFCNDVGTRFGMGAGIFGDAGTAWFESAAESPSDIAWTYGYMYASGDPHEDLEGFDWLANFRLDTAEQAGASIPTVTFYRMLNVGLDYGYAGSEAEVVQAMLADPDAVADYLDDFVAVLDVLAARETPPLLHVEPDSWGFMMWAFDGFDGTTGNDDPSAIPVALDGHPDLAGQNFPSDAAGLGQAMIYLRDQRAPDVRLGFHASNFRVGTRPEVVTGFYSKLGAWDVIVTEPPHMTGSGSNSWDTSDEDNQNNLDWLRTVSDATSLPILIWQTYASDAEPYLGDWPDNQDNLTLLAENGVAGVLWDPNGNGSDCAYSCADADTLLENLAAYSASPLSLPSGHVCSQ
jgi:hypothetical protein